MTDKKLRIYSLSHYIYKPYEYTEGYVLRSTQDQHTLFLTLVKPHFFRVFEILLKMWETVPGSGFGVLIRPLSTDHKGGMQPHLRNGGRQHTAFP